MARISIKKNFVDGDKLFAQQLNNNFETIEKAVNDGNKIVWQDGTEVTFKRYVTSDIDSLPISDGAIIYDTEKGRHYIDYQGKRIQVGSAGKEVVIQEEQPTEEDNKLWIDSDTVNTIGTEIVNEHTESETLGYSANYLNDRIVKVSSTQPETGEEVWIQKGKNLFNKANLTFDNKVENLSSGDTISVKVIEFSYDFFAASFELDNLNKNTNYVISANILTENFSSAFIYRDKLYGDKIVSGLIGDNIVFNTGDSTKVVIGLYLNSIQEGMTYSLENLQIEQGETPTPYETYIDKKVFVKNNNGVYEQFHKETEEVIFDGILQGGKTLNIDLSKYKRLYITCRVFDGYNNTAGVSNVIMMDLTKNGNQTKWYCASGVFQYLSGDFATIQNTYMSVFCLVDAGKTLFKPLFIFNNGFKNDSDEYSVQKIVGIK